MVFEPLFVRLNNSNWHNLTLERKTIWNVSFWLVAGPVRVVNNVEFCSIRMLLIGVVLSLRIVCPGTEN